MILHCLRCSCSHGMLPQYICLDGHGSALRERVVLLF